MIKNIYFSFLLIALLSFNGCSGYKPIFSSNNLDFTITKYTINGDKKLGKQLYSKLYNLSKSKKVNKNKNIILLINISSNKNETSKDSAGKVLEYRITLNTKIEIREYLTENKILNQTFNSSIIYKVQDQYSDTIKLENKSIDDLIEKTYQELIIRISESI